MLDVGESVAQFSKAPFVVRHELTGHPLFALDRLVALAATLPPASVEYNAGNLPLDFAGRATPATGMSVEETLRRIEEHNSWMVLQNVEQVPAYHQLLHACLDDVAAALPRLRGAMRQAEAFIFVSSAGAVTPYHRDPEHNFLLQLRGRKRVTVFDGSHASIAAAPGLEAFYAGMRHRSIEIPAGAESFATEFLLSEGAGLHIPVEFPHHVRVDSEAYSVSLSITFRTPDLYRRANAYYFNGFLRARGIVPHAVGHSSGRDRLKAIAGRALKAVRRIRQNATF